MSTQAPARPRLPIDPRIKDRRVAVVREEGRRRLRVVVALAVVLALGGAAFAATRSPLMDVDRLAVTGTEHTPLAEVRAAAGTDANPQLADFDTGAARRRIEALPWVLSATVARDWPNGVRVAIVERTPVAAVPGRDGWARVDVAGRILDVVDDPRPLVAIAAPPARRIAGRTIPAALHPALAVAAALDTESSHALRESVAAVAVAGEGSAAQVGLQLLAGGSINLGDASAIEAKVVAAATVLQTVSPAAVDTLDVRVPSAPVLRRKGAGPAPAAAGTRTPPRAATTTTTTASG